MFGSFIEFKWNTTTKQINHCYSVLVAEETLLLLLCYNYRPDEQIIDDYLAKQWIKDYTLLLHVSIC